MLFALLDGIVMSGEFVMRVLVACERSGLVRDAFAERGHYAVSVDLQASLRPGLHVIGDVFSVLDDSWDLLIAHPPCTYLARSGVCWLKCRPGRWELMLRARDFFMRLWDAPVARVVVENPTPHRYAGLPACSQSIQPYEFGHAETKRTCLWLRGVPPLLPVTDWRAYTMALPKCQRMPLWWGGSRASSLRELTFPGVARAFADQWG